jgi:hypothetical protein
MAAVEVQQQIGELESIRRQTRIWQISISVILLALVVGCVATLRGAAYGLVSEGPQRDKFVTDLSGRLQKNALPTIEQMGTQALHEINWQGEAAKLNRRTPEIAAASETEVKLLGEHLSERGQKVLDETFAAALRQREAKIRGMFPEATPEQLTNIMATLTQEAKDQAADISTSLFAEHKEALDDIVTDFTKIQLAEARHIKGETPTWEMGMLVFDIARDEIRDLEQTQNGKKSKKHGSKQEKNG